MAMNRTYEKGLKQKQCKGRGKEITKKHLIVKNNDN